MQILRLTCRMRAIDARAGERRTRFVEHSGERREPFRLFRFTRSDTRRGTDLARVRCDDQATYCVFLHRPDLFVGDGRCRTRGRRPPRRLPRCGRVLQHGTRIPLGDLYPVHVQSLGTARMHRWSRRRVRTERRRSGRG
jgi:hypothetical protein